jgi:homoserine kinase
MKHKTLAFAPATVANVAVGFDLLGFPIDGVGDTVEVHRVPEQTGVRIDSIEGVVTDLPSDPEKNTASAALLAMQEDLQLPYGFRIAITKGIPLGSGMGGSAASAVAAVVAANGLLDEPLETDWLLPYCLAGEKVASGAAHADNAAPSLCGGLTVVVGKEPPRVVRVPVPSSLVCVLVHPHLQIETRQARAALPSEIPLSLAVDQSMYLSGFLAGCYADDVELIGRSLVDLFAEPTRAPLIPGFETARSVALSAGALALAISGSGPSVFAWADRSAGKRVEAAICGVFADGGLETDSWVGPIGKQGARLVKRVGG